MSSFDSPLQTKEVYEDFFFMASFLVSGSHETFVKKYRWFWGGLSMPVAPVAYQVIILEPGIGQFREFECPRVHTCVNSWGLFLVHKLTCEKRESVS